jgi:hypothetical protein
MSGWKRTMEGGERMTYSVYASEARPETEKKVGTWADAMNHVTKLLIEGWAFPTIETPQLRITGFGGRGRQ